MLNTLVHSYLIQYEDEEEEEDDEMMMMRRRRRIHQQEKEDNKSIQVDILDQMVYISMQ